MRTASVFVNAIIGIQDATSTWNASTESIISTYWLCMGMLGIIDIVGIIALFKNAIKMNGQ